MVLWASTSRFLGIVLLRYPEVSSPPTESIPIFQVPLFCIITASESKQRELFQDWQGAPLKYSTENLLVNVYEKTTCCPGKHPWKNSSSWCLELIQGWEYCLFPQPVWKTSHVTVHLVEYTQRSCLGCRKQWAMQWMLHQTHVTDKRKKARLKRPHIIELHPRIHLRLYSGIEKYIAPNKLKFARSHI